MSLAVFVVALFDFCSEEHQHISVAQKLESTCKTLPQSVLFIHKLALTSSEPWVEITDIPCSLLLSRCRHAHSNTDVCVDCDPRCVASRKQHGAG